MFLLLVDRPQKGDHLSFSWTHERDSKVLPTIRSSGHTAWWCSYCRALFPLLGGHMLYVIYVVIRTHDGTKNHVFPHVDTPYFF